MCLWASDFRLHQDPLWGKLLKYRSPLLSPCTPVMNELRMCTSNTSPADVVKLVWGPQFEKGCFGSCIMFTLHQGFHSCHYLWFCYCCWLFLWCEIRSFIKEKLRVKSVGHCCCCSVIKLCLALCDPMDCSTPGFPVHHQLLELAQTYQVSDAIQPSHPLSSPSPLAFNLSQHQGLFQ